ncbi:AAA family ATPase [Candidatus Woesearchaeota archaeon CG10_big_fil_rev_8_21_14_0_10_44_13]|nr:MAG: AAA family ATPase [Candidatus Woesearchaeota archaeon CG10_big_fil_rev_8_21_14_0_10_44_13]
MISDKIKPKLMEKDPFQDILGQEKVKYGLKSALLMGRNVLIVGPAGIGKTTLAKNVAKLMPGGKFIRVQGSPDLTVEDLIGDIDPIKALKFGPTSKEVFTPGKIFKANGGVLFFDELNRCPEKIQNALLQALEERKVTIGSYDVDFDASFIFIGTMNPDDSSTEKLSDVLLDRFDVIYMGYPDSLEIESRIVRMKGKKTNVSMDDKLVNVIVLLVRLLRENRDVEKKPGVRATLGLYERAQSNALLKGKKKVDFDDAKEAIISVLAHRIKLRPSIQYLKSPEEFVKEELERFMRQNKKLIEELDKGGLL